MYIISKLVFDRARIQIQPKPLHMGVSTGYHRNELSREEGEGHGRKSAWKTRCLREVLKGGSLPRSKQKVVQRERGIVQKPKPKFWEWRTEQSYIQQLIHCEGFTRKLFNTRRIVVPLRRISKATKLNCGWEDREE